MLTMPVSGTYDGIELVAFPPNVSAHKAGGYWSEVVTVCAASFPERDGVNLLAHMSVRNWGEVRGAKRSVHRSLDVFLPQVEDLDGIGPRRHGAFGLTVRGEGAQGKRTWVGSWRHREGENVFRVLAEFTGMRSLASQVPLVPVVEQDGDGGWILPRLGTVHGDKWLPGGTGLPMGDERAFAHAVGASMAGIGLVAAPPIHRYRPRRRRGNGHGPAGTASRASAARCSKYRKRSRVTTMTPS